MSNFITLEKAKQMTALYRQEMNNVLADPFKGKNILVFSETFDREAFDALLAEDDCTFIRIYYGMSEDLKIHAIGVGVNSKNEDILPAEGIAAAESKVASLTAQAVIIEQAQRCPDSCPSTLL
jgi:hypothetical protein